VNTRIRTFTEKENEKSLHKLSIGVEDNESEQVRNQ
jgi:hypothetical protein